MARSGEGESEVLLGNRQLLSLFVIVVILLAVFFTMGYVLGKNSGAAGSEVVASREEGVSTPAPAPPSAFAEPPRQPDAAANTSVPAPAAGQTFLQVRALKRPEAELIAKVLGKQGFSIVLAPAPAPSEGLFRVLVGPLRDADAVRKTRTELEKAGFTPFLQRY